MKTKSVPLRFDEPDHREFKTFCVQHGFSMQEFVLKCVRKEMNRYKGDQDKAV